MHYNKLLGLTLTLVGDEALLRLSLLTGAVELVLLEFVVGCSLLAAGVVFVERVDILEGPGMWVTETRKGRIFREVFHHIWYHVEAL